LIPEIITKQQSTTTTTTKITKTITTHATNLAINCVNVCSYSVDMLMLEWKTLLLKLKFGGNDCGKDDDDDDDDNDDNEDDVRDVDNEFDGVEEDELNNNWCILSLIE
jgi:hypothetical protein